MLLILHILVEIVFANQSVHVCPVTI